MKPGDAEARRPDAAGRFDPGRPTVAGVPVWLSWAAFCAAFSPVLVDLARTFAAYPSTRPSLVAWGLLAWSVARHRSAGPRVRRLDGLLLLVAGVLLEMIGIVSESWSFARLGLATGIVGLSRAHGQPPLGVALLAFFAIPPPYFVAASLSPDLESLLAELGAGIASSLGLAVEARGPALNAGTGRIDLIPSDGGVVTAQMLAGLGWFVGVVASAAPARSLAYAAIGASLAFPMQLVGVTVAAIATGGGFADAGRWWLTYALWPLLAAAGLLVARKARPSAGRTSGEKWR